MFNGSYSRIQYSVLILILLATVQSFSCGLGKVGGFYQVTTYEDLKLVGVGACSLDSSYRLTTDIDAGASASERCDGGGLNCAGFVPIGSFMNKFVGLFNGGGNTISNLLIKSASDYTALISFLGESGLIDSLILSNSTASGERFVGGIVGINYGKIINTSFSGTIDGDMDTGGITGGNSGTIRNVTSSVTITGNRHVGGITGINEGVILKTKAEGIVTGNDYSIGGIAGNNSNDGSLSECLSNSNVIGPSRVGGLAGSNMGSIYNSVSLGEVTGEKWIGGAVGHNWAKIEHVLSRVEVHEMGTPSNIGGIVGEDKTGGTDQIFWEKSGYTGRGIGSVTSDAEDIVGLSASELTDYGIYSNWDFYTIWYMGADTPSLRFLTNKKNHVISEYPFQDIIPKMTLRPLPSTTAAGDSITYESKNILAAIILPGQLGILDTGIVNIRISIDGNQDYLPSIINHTFYIIEDISGNGSESLPWEINSYQKFLTVGRESFLLSDHYQLTADIDAAPSFLESCDGNNRNCKGFVQIGSKLNPFIGFFHGSGHAIRNFNMTRPGENNVALFGEIGENAVVDSFSLAGSIEGYENVAAIAVINKGTIKGIVNKASVTGTWYTSGIASTNEGVIESTCNTADIKGNYKTAGISIKNSGMVKRACNSGEIFGKDIIASMVIGSGVDTIINSYNIGNIVETFFYAGQHDVGGFYANVEGNGHINTVYNNIEIKSFDTLSGGNSNISPIVTSGFSGDLIDSYWNFNEFNVHDSTRGYVNEDSLSTISMKTSTSFTNWNFIDVWRIVEGRSYPLLRGMINPPQAFTDTLPTLSRFDLTHLFHNAYNDNPDSSYFTLNLLEHSAGVSDSSTFIDLTEAITNSEVTVGDTISLYYRIGTIDTKGDTLWGNRAHSSIVLIDLSLDSIPNKTYGDSAFDIVASVTPEFPILYSSSEHTILSLNGISATITGAGSVEATVTVGPMLSQSIPIHISPVSLTVNGAVAHDKIYDGNDSALVTDVALTGAVNNDTITFDYSTHFNTSSVGADISVEFYDITLTGAKALNYTVTQPATLQASITPRTLNLDTIHVADKVYDGTATATITPGLLTEVVLGDDVIFSYSQAFFESALVGDAQTVTIESPLLTGGDASNYVLQLPTFTASITPLPEVTEPQDSLINEIDLPIQDSTDSNNVAPDTDTTDSTDIVTDSTIALPIEDIPDSTLVDSTQVIIAPLYSLDGLSSVYVVNGGIEVDGYRGDLNIYTINGTRISTLNVHRDGFYDLNLPRGIYNLKFMKKITK